MNASSTTTKTGHSGDTQKVELLGRNRLIDELLRDDLEVALPVRDRGIDLIAYADLISATATLRCGRSSCTVANLHEDKFSRRSADA